MRLTGNRNQCRGCNQYFNSNTAFDMHRTGEFGVNRRCMTQEEMKARGMLVNKDGFWISEAMTRKFHEDEAFEDDTETLECQPRSEGSEQTESSQVGAGCKQTG